MVDNDASPSSILLEVAQMCFMEHVSVDSSSVAAQAKYRELSNALGLTDLEEGSDSAVVTKRKQAV